MFDKILLVWLLILSHCQPALAVGSMKFSRIDVQTKNGTSTTNYVKNPSGFKNALDVTTSSASIAQDVTGSSDLIDGVASLVCDASAQNGYCEWDSETIQEGDKTGNCEAKAIFKGDASLYKLQVADGSGVLTSSAVLSNATDWTEVSVNYSCGSTRKVRLTQTESGTGAAVNIGRVYWGRATNLGEVAQAQIYGSAYWVGVASCGWTKSGAIGNYSADTDCNNPTVEGNASAPGTKIPGIVFSSLPPGKYVVTFTTSQFYCGSTSDCYLRISDGTTNGETKVTNANHAQRYNLIQETFTYSTAQGSTTFQLQGGSGDASTMDIYANVSGYGMKATVEYFPLDSQIAISDNNTPWYIDATMDGGTPGLGLSSVASYTEITNSSLTLKPQSGSAPVGVMCSASNSATSPSTGNTTCSVGDESLGINFSIPKAGSYEVCAQFAHEMVADASEYIVAAFQLIETPTNAQTLTLEGGTRSQSYLQGSATDTGGGWPISSCSIFNWSSNGIKGVRLMYEQLVGGTPDTSNIAMDGSGSVGQRNLRWTVKPVTNASPMPLLTGSVTSNSTGLERVERAYLNCDSGSAITSQSGSWISSIGNISSGTCTVTIASGIFSSTPVCVMNQNANVGTLTVGAQVSVSSATSFSITGAYNTGATTTTQTAFDANVICMGPR